MILFNDRKGQTILSPTELKGIKLSHITNMSELDEAEQVNINEGLLWLKSQEHADFLNETFLLKLHKQLFGQVWKWAGKYRTSEKNIGIEAWKIPTEIHKFIADTKYWIANNSYTHWEALLAHFHHRLVSIHPFPNGNGRFSRIYTNHLCLKNHKPIPTWLSQVTPKTRRAIYIKALRDADQKDFSPLIDFFSPRPH